MDGEIFFGKRDGVDFVNFSIFYFGTLFLNWIKFSGVDIDLNVVGRYYVYRLAQRLKGVNELV